MKTQAGMRFRVRMFGGLEVQEGDRTVARLQPHKPGVLLAYLALHAGRAHHREELMEVLWPEVDPAAGRNRLKQTLSVLRAEVEPEGLPEGSILVADRSFVRLNADNVATDAGQFEEACRQATHAANEERQALLTTAVGLYRGGLLPGFYDDWAVAERERLAGGYVSALLGLASELEARGELEAAADHARRAVAAEPTHEPAHLALMRLCAMLGCASDAVRQYRQMERVLDEELGEEPSGAARSLLREIREGRFAVAAARLPAKAAAHRPEAAVCLEPVGGAVPLASQFYIVRETDREFVEAIARRDSIVLVKGPRQIGKTSLLARGLQQARDSGARVALTDLQRLTGEQMASADALFRAFADAIREELDLDGHAEPGWDAERGWNVNFERFLRREVLGRDEAPLVWGLDEVDRLFGCSYGSEVFGLFRSWHNLRSLHPDGPWSRLTLAMAYATEAHLFITDLNQSPFNVGTRLTLRDFTLDQVEDLNARYGSPLRDPAEVSRYFGLVGGIPYLVRRGLHELAQSRIGIDELEAAVRRDDGPFRDHLQRLLMLVGRDDLLAAAVREVVRGGPCDDADSFYRLRSAGVLSGDPAAPRFRCGLYAQAFGLRLGRANAA